VSVIVWPTQEKSRSGCAFQTHDPTQPTKNKNYRPTTNPTEPNTTSGSTQAWTTLTCHKSLSWLVHAWVDRLHPAVFSSRLESLQSTSAYRREWTNSTI